MSPKKLTAAICTYNRYDLLDKAIMSLAVQTLRVEELEILVIDNSPDENRSKCEAARYEGIENLRWIYEPVAGLSNARNVAFREASANLVAYLDDDAIADAKWAQSICRAFDEFGTTCQVVGGKVDPIWSAPRPSWLTDGLLGYLSVVDYGDESRFLTEGEWVAGANIAYRTATLRRIGGFEVSLGRVGSGNSLMSNEEVALTVKIKQGGGRIVYEPAAKVAHLVDRTRLTQRWFRRRVAWQAVSDCIGASTSKPIGLEGRWEAVKRFFLHCAPADRTIRALAQNKDSAGEFEWQLGALYDFTICLLTGLSDADNG